MKKPVVQQAPVSLTGLFGDGSDSEGETNNQADEPNGHFENESEIKTMDFCGTELNIRQMTWHRANANQVWPGTFTLLDHIVRVTVETSNESSSCGRYADGLVLELGSATGALAIALQKKGNYELITSDIDDEGEVQSNVEYNYQLNNMKVPQHIAHTWGQPWNPPKQPLGLKYIIASDILLYVSAYAGLVQSLRTIFDTEPDLIEFMMSWNRRIAESTIFFDLMRDAGFHCYNYGRGLYSFYLPERKDSYLQSLPPEVNHNLQKKK